MRRLSGTDVVVLVVRALILGFLLLAYRFLGASALNPDYVGWLPLVALTAVVGTILFAGALLLFPMHHRQIYTLLLPIDLAAAALAIYATESPEPVYVALIIASAIYALLFPMPLPGVAAIGAAGTWFLASIPHIDSPYIFVTRLFQSVAIVAGDAVIYRIVRRERVMRSRAQDSAIELEEANAELSRRVIELNAISEIAVAIHSTLDFDQVGRLVLDILQKVLNLRACSLMIIDRQEGETLFTASHGLTDEQGHDLAFGDSRLTRIQSADGMLKCIPLLSHEKITAVLCAGADAIDDFTEDDMLVLSAIASELAVAIDNAQLYKLTKRLAVTDDLTGLYNYRYLRQRIELEIERAQRYLRPVSLLFLDVDNFKLHNDTYGHAAGDRVLAEMAGVFRQKCRDLDVVARYGGEEFGIILPETDASGAFVVAEKLRESVAAHAFEGSAGVRDEHLSVSIGVATYPVHAGSAEELLKQADDALYRAKNSGRDKVCCPPKERAVT